MLHIAEIKDELILKYSSAEESWQASKQNQHTKIQKQHV